MAWISIDLRFFRKGLSFLVVLTGLAIASFSPGTEGVDAVLGDIVWSRTYDFGSDDYTRADYARMLIQTSDGGFILAGYMAGGVYDVPILTDAWLVKTDAHGVWQWEKVWVSWDYNLIFSKGIQTADGGFLLAGTCNTWISEVNIPSGWLVKTDAAGNEQWSTSYGQLHNGQFNDIIQTVDGEFVLAGNHITFVQTGEYWWQGYKTSDLWLVKTDASGEVEWEKFFGGQNWDAAHAVIQTADGGFILVGSLNGNAWAVKTGPWGGYKWSFTYGPGMFTSIIKTVDGDFLLAGAMDGDAKLLKITAHGEHLWARNYGGALDDGANAVIQTADGGFALIGNTRSFGAGGSDAWLVKTTADGDVEWKLTFGGRADDEASAIIEMADGTFVFAGTTASYGSDGSDAWLVKTTSPETTSPRLSAPEDIMYEEGMTGHVITWAVEDRHPGTYELCTNSQLVDSGAWANGTIIWNVDGFTSGTYNVTLIVWDAARNSISDTVWVTVFAAAAPELSASEDITYVEGTTGYVITWEVEDYFPGSYAIYTNSEQVDSGSWTNGTIPWNIDGLTLGTYNITLVLWDEAGNSVSDTVWVTVTTPATPPLPELSVISTPVLLSLVALAILRVRRKRLSHEICAGKCYLDLICLGKRL